MPRIALCQLNSGADPAANLELIRGWTARAAGDGARVVVFPEAAMAAFGVPLGPLAEPIDGPWATAVSAIAAEHDVLVVAGMFTPAGERVRNTLLVTGLGVHRGYDKIHLYDAFGFQESKTVAPGEATATIPLNEPDGTVLGLATCYDVRFPELFQRLAVEGASVVLLPASWGAGEGKREQWELLVRARALDSGSWVLACDQADPAVTGVEVNPKAPTGIGFSTVADPFGRVHAQLDADAGLLVVDVDPALSTASREATAVLPNRRL